MSARNLLRLCEAAEIAAGCAKRAEAEDRAYAVYNVDGVFHVSQDECTHGPGYLSEGYILDGEIECPYHQGRFDIATGRPTCAPCHEPIKVWKVEIVDGAVCIDPSEHE